MMSLLGCLAITEGYIVAYLATKLQKESYTIDTTAFKYWNELSLIGSITSLFTSKK